MKILVLFGICVLLHVVVSALVPTPPPNKDDPTIQSRRRLQALQVHILEDRDREQRYDDDVGSDDRPDYDQTRSAGDDESDDDDDDDDGDDDGYRASQLEAIARRLNAASKVFSETTERILIKQYIKSWESWKPYIIFGGYGRLRVTYVPPQQGNIFGYSDLGSLSFRYLPPSTSANSENVANKYLGARYSYASPYSTGVYHHHPQLIRFGDGLNNRGYYRGGVPPPNHFMAGTSPLPDHFRGGNLPLNYYRDGTTPAPKYLRGRIPPVPYRSGRK